MRIQAKLRLARIAQRYHGLDQTKTPTGILVLQFSRQNLGLERGGLVGILTFHPIDDPGKIVAIETAVPVFVLNVIDAVRGYNNGIILPVFDRTLRGLAGILAIGDDQVVIRQLHIQIIQQALFSSVHWLITEVCLDNLRHIVNVLIIWL